MSGQIFISYRREESEWSARSLHSRLCWDFDPKQIFMDIDAIPLGEDFVQVIETMVAKCDVLIAVIGKNWLTSKDDRGDKRLHNPEDFVRMEIGTALKRGIRVIPLLVDGAVMPRSTDLPDDLKLLVRRNALQITNTSFGGDCRRLVAAIKLVFEKAATPTPLSAPPPVTWTMSSDPAFFNDRGWEFQQEGDYDKAINDYNEAIRLDPTFARAYHRRGYAYHAKKDHGKAISDYNEAIRLKPDDPSAYYNRGLAYYDKKDYDKAINDYSEAIRLNPNLADAYYSRSLAYMPRRITARRSATTMRRSG